MDKNSSGQNKSNKVLFGLGWSSISTIFNGLSQILRLSILARFLEKEDFGIVAILTLILGFTQVFSDMGFSAAIMSEKKLSKSNFISLYWLQFIVFNSILIVGSLASPLVAVYYEEASLVYLVPLMLSELFFFSIGKLYDTVLQKQFRFKIIAIRNIVASVFSLLLAIVLAQLGAGVYSMILSTISQCIIVNFWNFISGQKTYKLKLQKIKIKEVRPLLKVGYYQMGAHIIDYVAGEFDIFIISSFLGMGAVGVYNLAKDLVLKFTTVINTIVVKVMLPFLAEKNDDIRLLTQTFFTFIKYLSLINIPILGIVFLFPDVLVDIFYGSGYEDAVTIVRIMSVWSLIVILNNPNGHVAVALKRTDITFAYTILRLLILGSLLLLFARENIIYAALTMVGSYFIMFIVNWYMLLYRLLHLKILDYARAFYKPLLSVCLIVFLCCTIRYLVNSERSLSLTLSLLCAYCLLYVAYLFLCEKDVVLKIKHSIHSFINNKG